MAPSAAYTWSCCAFSRVTARLVILSFLQCQAQAVRVGVIAVLHTRTVKENETEHSATRRALKPSKRNRAVSLEKHFFHYSCVADISSQCDYTTKFPKSSTGHVTHFQKRSSLTSILWLYTCCMNVSKLYVRVCPSSFSFSFFFLLEKPLDHHLVFFFLCANFEEVLFAV